MDRAAPTCFREALDAAITTQLAALERPSDWGRDPTVPRLLRRWLQLRDTLYGMFLDAEAAVGPDASRLKREMAAAYEQRELTALREAVEALTEAQRVELVTPPEAPHPLTDDPWALDALTARKALGRFLADGSPAVRAGQAQLDRALNG